MSNRKSLVLRGVAECVTEEELDKLLSNKNNLRKLIVALHMIVSNVI